MDESVHLRARHLFWLTAPARLLILLSMGAPMLWDHQRSALIALLAVALLWTLSQGLTALGPRYAMVPVAEAVAFGVICGVSADHTTAILPGLVVAPYVAGLARGPVGVAVALSGEVLSFVAVALFAEGLDVNTGLGAFTWAIAGLGLGLIATFVRSTALDNPDELDHYRSAQSLIRQLIDISGGLRSGLDVSSLGGAVLSRISDSIPVNTLSLYLPQGEALIPLLTKTVTRSPDNVLGEEAALQAWSDSEQVVLPRAFAFPLGDRVVIGGVLAADSEMSTHDLERLLARVRYDLAPRAVHFDTALLFAEFRDRASADERQRLAREMHDGVAQDIASLGYLVDALAARPANDKQAKQLDTLRDRISAIIAEVRRSVMSLRTSIGESESLGAAISSVARHVSESSGTPIHVTLDEHSVRLRSEVEAELFRIAQEAMNNAIKHAKASRIDVHVQVHAPDALITVSDDGRGMQTGRSDSHGLKIMRERAGLIGAELTILDPPQGGLAVQVRLGSQTMPQHEFDEHDERVTT